MSRKNDRKHAFCLVFQMDSGGECDVNEELAYYLENFAEETASEPDFILGEVAGVRTNLAEIDAHIDETSTAWDISRISKVDLAIMRLAVYEILYNPDIGDGVSINEAVELAKAFSTEESSKFVNGVLGKIARKLKETEQ
ncbi:MAG: transcription antitermination factor NusB [Defluviitaleaceae bacterium]|nr:transcription antitermination factor NusB [Defluviitaleaceae bacterium]